MDESFNQANILLLRFFNHEILGRLEFIFSPAEVNDQQSEYTGVYGLSLNIRLVDENAVIGELTFVFFCNSILVNETLGIVKTYKNV